MPQLLGIYLQQPVSLPYLVTLLDVLLLPRWYSCLQLNQAVTATPIKTEGYESTVGKL